MINDIHFCDITDMVMVILICVFYAPIAPIVLPAGMLYFFCFLCVMRYNFIAVYHQSYDSGGMLFFDLFNFTMAILGVSVLALQGYLTLRGAPYWTSLSMTPLAFGIYMFWKRTLTDVGPAAEKMSLASALVFDHCMSDRDFPLQLFRQAYTDPDLKTQVDANAQQTNFGGFKHLRRNSKDFRFSPGQSQDTSENTSPRGSGAQELGPSTHYGIRLAPPSGPQS